jgi:hypothetical protein
MYEVQRRTSLDPTWRPLRQGMDHRPMQLEERRAALETVAALARGGGLVRLVDLERQRVLWETRVCEVCGVALKEADAFLTDDGFVVCADHYERWLVWSEGFQGAR